MLSKINYLFLFIFISFSSYSQSRFGIETGISISSLKLKDGDYNNTKPGLGLKTGINYHYKINKILSLETALLYIQKGERNSYTQSGLTMQGNWINDDELETYKLNYLELPFNINFKLKNIILSGGFYFSKALSCSYTVNTTRHDSQSGEFLGGYSRKVDLLTYNYTNPFNSSMQAEKVDYGLNFGLGYQIGRFMIKSNFELGLPYVIENTDMDVFRSSNMKYKNRSLSLSLSYDLLKIKSREDINPDTAFNKEKGFLFDFQFMGLFFDKKIISINVGYKIGKLVYFAGYELIKYHPGSTIGNCLKGGIQLYPHRNIRDLKIFYQSFISNSWYTDDRKYYFFNLGAGIDYFITKNFTIGYNCSLGYGRERNYNLSHSEAALDINLALSVKYFLFEK